MSAAWRPPFAIGARVLVVDDHYPRTKGMTGVVVSFDRSCCPYNVELSDGSTLAFNDGEIEVIP